MIRTQSAGAAVLAVLFSSSLAAAQDAPPTDATPIRPVDAPSPEPSAAPAAASDAKPAAKRAAKDETDVVTVAGTKVSKTAGSAHVIRSDQLERFGYDDPHKVLTTVPGVYARGEDGVGLRPNIGLRGVNPDRSKKVTLLEDGILFAPAPYSASAAYYFPLIMRMTQVRVIKGPAAISYGPHTVGGAIDLITRPIPTVTSGEVDAAYGEYGYGKLHGWAGSSNEKIGFLAEGAHLRSDGFKELPNGGDTGFYRNEFMFKGQYIPDPQARDHNEFRAKFTYSDEVSNETYLGLTDADFRANPDRRYAASTLDRMNNHRTAISLTHVFEPSKTFSINTTIYHTDFQRTWRKVNRFRGADIFEVLTNPNSPRNQLLAAVLRGEADGTSADQAILVGPNQRDFVTHGLETRIRADATTGAFSHRIEYGLRVHYDRVERRQSEDAFRMTNGALVPEGSPTVVNDFNEAHTDALAMHVIDAVSVGPLTVTPGVRVEAMHSVAIDRKANTQSSRLLQVVLPGAGAYYGITKDLGVLAGAYRGFSPPVPGNPVDPELSVNYEAGARYTHGRARADVIGFYNDYQNLSDICTLSSGCVDANLDRQFDAGRARIYGIEAYAEHRPRLASDLHLPIQAAYTLMFTEFMRTFTSDDPIFGNVRAGDEIPYVPKHQLNASVGLETSRVGGSVAMSYVAAMREKAGSTALDSPETIATDDQVLFDLSAYYNVLPKIRLYVNARNLFDERYIVARRPFGARPNAPRWIQVGVKIAF